ncbi:MULTISPECIES: DUF559 domain-containing protein [unclassified Mesorhizobium]|uniref:endonuclease domain-containing protein n=2 Tax=Mesorhizobium TaxID=68287 RepID=UPI001FEF4244|nr:MULTISPECIES: DUF559 domain-containing protein [unclassified Mesorhizobium]
MKQALSARICKSLDTVFMVVQPIALCLSVGRFSAAFGSWKSLIQGRVGSSRPDRTPKISGKGDSGQPSCYGLFTSPWMGEVAAKRRVGVTARLLMPKLDRFKLRSVQRLRAAMTDEERTLWRHLWRIPVERHSFRKQASVGIYFPDFISHRLKLIVEVDGAHHSFDRQQRHDEIRTKWFESQGYRVIRFWNHEIKNELDSVLDTIYAAVEERKSDLRPSDAEGA